MHIGVIEIEDIVRVFGHMDMPGLDAAKVRGLGARGARIRVS